MSVVERVLRPQVQPSVEIYDPRAKDRHQPRWLIYLGDRIAKRRKQEVHWLRSGGMEEQTKPCIQKYVIPGYIPRAYATPVEQGMNIMPEDHLRHAGGQRLKAISVDGAIVENDRALGYTLLEPGDAIANILNRAYNDQGRRNGITEARSLYGRRWTEVHKVDGSGVMDRVEALCFADGQAETLRGLRSQIASGLMAAAQENLRFDDGTLFDLDTYGLECEQSGDEFFDWGMARLDEEHTNLRTGTHSAGLVYRYSPIGELLLVQLEVVRQDRSQIEQWKQQFGQMNQAEPPPTYTLADMIELSRKLERAEARIAQLEGKATEEVEAQAAVAEPKLVACEACGEEVKAAGMNLHRARWCTALHPKTEG